jgi:sialic acid synthase SpsE
MAYSALGQVSYVQGDLEASFRKYRRSLFFVRNLPAGAQIGADDVRSLRPGDGLPPKFLSAVVGQKVRSAVTRGTPVSWEALA